MNKPPIKLDEKEKVKRIKRVKKILNIYLCISILLTIMVIIVEVFEEALDLNKIITYSTSALLSVMMLFVVHKIE